MKTDSVTFTTKRSLSEVSNLIRKAAAKLRADMDAPAMSPFGDVGFMNADLSVALSGCNSILGGPRKWGVQVIVKDTGHERRVELIAVGDNAVNILRFGSFGNAFFQLDDSINRRNTIQSMIV